MADEQNLAEAIEKVCEDLWTQYDKDNSGTLDKAETRKFVAEVCGTSGADVDGEEFDKFFKELDADGSGTLEKEEIKKFIRGICGC